MFWGSGSRRHTFTVCLVSELLGCHDPRHCQEEGKKADEEVTEEGRLGRLSPRISWRDAVFRALTVFVGIKERRAGLELHRHTLFLCVPILEQ